MQLGGVEAPRDRAAEFDKSQVPVGRELRLHPEDAGAMEGMRE